MAITAQHVVIIGAGIGGLAAATALSAAGLRVTVVERAPTPGGKLRTLVVGGQEIDAGPTVLTSRTALDALFHMVDEEMADHLTLVPATTLGRYFWPGSPHLDIHADRGRTADAIAAFASPKDAAAYQDLCRDAERAHAALDRPFLRGTRPSSGFDLLRRAGFRTPRLHPTQTFAAAVATRLQDPRLRELFGQFSTEHGTPPRLAPAAALLLAHMRLADTWTIEGGMHRLATALAALAQRAGATLRFETAAREIVVADGRTTGVRLEDDDILTADAVVMNGEPAALAAGLLGAQAVSAGSAPKFPHRSLSAVTWAALADVGDAPLLHHNTFFNPASRAASDFIENGLLPPEPTVRLCAQDRTNDSPDFARSHFAHNAPERFLVLIDAPANGDRRSFSQVEVDQCMQGIRKLLGRCGVTMVPAAAPIMTSPATFNRLFPASAGALYGPAIRGWSSALRRPGARTKLRGLYLTGGSTHPGPGLGLAALSGLQAAHSVATDLAKTCRRSAPTRSATPAPAPLPTS